MSEFVYKIESAKKSLLQKVLDENPFAEDSFAKLGYFLKDSKAIELPEGFFYLFFETSDGALAKKLVAKLTQVEGLTECGSKEKSEVINKVREEQDNAVQGFGAVFG